MERLQHRGNMNCLHAAVYLRQAGGGLPGVIPAVRGDKIVNEGGDGLQSDGVRGDESGMMVHHGCKDLLGYMHATQRRQMVC